MNLNIVAFCAQMSLYLADQVLLRLIIVASWWAYLRV